MQFRRKNRTLLELWAHFSICVVFKKWHFLKTDLKTVACLPALLTWLSETQWVCWPSHLFRQLCPHLQPLGSSVGGSRCCLPDWCWRRWNWSSALSLAPVMTGPPSGSQNRLVEKRSVEVCWSGHVLRSGGQHTEVCRYLNFLEKTFDFGYGYDEKRLMFYPGLWNSRTAT